MGTRHILIIGAGLVGLSTAWYAVRKGHRVTVVDSRGTVREGCSYGNAGLVVPSHIVPLASPGVVRMGVKWMWSRESPFCLRPSFSPELWSWVWQFWRSATPEHVSRCAPLLRDLNLASRVEHEALAGALDMDLGLARRGLLMLCRTEECFAGETRSAELARRLGLTARVLTCSELSELEPSVGPQVAGGVLYPQDYHLSPRRLMAGLQARLEREGVTFRWATQPTAWTRDRENVRALLTTRGEIQADAFVICAGAWSARIARWLGAKLPLLAGKGYSITLPYPPRMPRQPAILTEARVAVTPLGRTVRFAGTMELGARDLRIDPRRVDGIVKSVAAYLPDFTPAHFRAVKPWSGLRPCTPDGLPYVGCLAGCRNVSVGTGHAMMGFSLGPVTGKLLAEVLSEERPSLPLEGLDPGRFDRRRV